MTNAVMISVRSLTLTLPLFYFVVAGILISGVSGDAFRRFHEESEARNVIERYDSNNKTLKDDNFDTVTLENYLRNYRHGPHRDYYMLFNNDIIAAYAGPTPKGHPDENDAPANTKGIIRSWMMFDSKTFQYCDLDAVYDWGQLALFSCPKPGLYRAYAIETYVQGDIPRANRINFKSNRKFVLGWFTRSEKESFNLLAVQNPRDAVFILPSSQEHVKPAIERMKAVVEWSLGKNYDYVDENGNQVTLTPKPVVLSDPVRLRDSFYCYYWMYSLREISREGYVKNEIIPFDGKSSDASSKSSWTANIMYDLLIWIAEPNALGVDGIKETLETEEEIVVSEYSKVLTRKFSESGLFPCLRKAHPSVEVVQEITYKSEADPDTGSRLIDTPHWKAIIRIHMDRLISTLSDITFTIASRQASATFQCFVGETRVFLRHRDFQFVPMRQLQPDDVNLKVSSLSHDVTTHNFEFMTFDVYGHGVHYIGNKVSKRYQPASYRTDMVIIPNPCIVQEFAIAVGGSLYIAEGLLRKGSQQAKKVVLPYFKPDPSKDTELPGNQDFLRAFDVAFTPTHVLFLMSEGYVVLQSSSTAVKGISEISSTMKYRPDGFVKRRWCPRTASPKLSSMMIPIYGDKGNLIILQVYLTEGNVPMWVTPLSQSCLPEGTGIVKKTDEQTLIINETDIHYEEFASVERTNQKTGLKDPPVPSRPPPPPPPERDIFEETTFILDSSRHFVVEGEDPHFPLERLNPASHVLNNDLKDYNQAKIYVVHDSKGMDLLLEENGLSIVEAHYVAVEFTAVEKQFVFALTFTASQISGEISSSESLQAIISTVTITNFPYRVKLTNSDKGDEHLDTNIPFPAVILVRMKHYQVKNTKSRDHVENIEHASELQGKTVVPFVPEIHTLGTASPTYVINLGDVLVFSSVDSRYARPLHYFKWNVTDKIVRSTPSRPLFFTDSSIKFATNDFLYDVLVTEQGLISVLRRKERRHLVQDDEDCMVTPDTETQKVIMGSVATLDGLREVKPFFRNDNIFQRGTHEGEIIYGVYDIKPRSSFKSCLPGSSRNDTEDDNFPCIEQATETASNRLIPVCTVDQETRDGPCRDPGYLQFCVGPQDPKHACIRKNKGCTEADQQDESAAYTPPLINDTSKCDPVNKLVATECLPRHAPREDIRTVNILGTSYHSYLQGSLQSVRALHPEANLQNDTWKEEIKLEPDMCPFVSFEVYSKEIDFAEVGYQIRVTSQISYIGTGIPPEADIMVEYQRIMGVVVEISTSLEEIRQLTRIVKTVDLHFHMPDNKLEKLMSVDPAEKHRIRTLGHDFEDIRAREQFSVLSLTFRPTMVNTRCKSTEYFRTVQFNVGCNAFSTVRLMSEATALKKINWTETLDEQRGFQWHRDYSNWNLTIPKVHIFYKQLKKNVFRCDQSFCKIPYFHLFKDDIYTLSYRDYFTPKFEQFLTVSSRPVTANVVMYDLLGSDVFNWTLNKYKAGCLHVANFWYKKLLAGTKDINKGTFEHENIYLYYKDCFNLEDISGNENVPLNILYKEPYYLFNRTNMNSVKFLRNRNEIFIFRAVVTNTFHNRFTYCKQLDTFFLVRITGIPIPRQGLKLWQYVLTILSVVAAFFVWYLIFAKFYTWTISPA